MVRKMGLRAGGSWKPFSKCFEKTEEKRPVSTFLSTAVLHNWTSLSSMHLACLVVTFFHSSLGRKRAPNNDAWRWHCVDAHVSWQSAAAGWNYCIQRSVSFCAAWQSVAKIIVERLWIITVAQFRCDNFQASNLGNLAFNASSNHHHDIIPSKQPM